MQIALRIRKLAVLDQGSSATRRPLGTDSPLGRELSGVVVEQLFAIDSVAGERPAAEVVDEQVVGNCQPKPGPQGPFGEIVVVKEPQSKSFVEPADLFVNSPLHEQAKSGQLRYGKPAPATLVAPLAGEAVHFIQILVGAFSTNCGGVA